MIPTCLGVRHPQTISWTRGRGCQNGNSELDEEEGPMMSYLEVLVSGFRRAYSSRGCASAVLTVLYIVCPVSSRLHAQVLYGSLTGNVIDASSAPIPGAKVDVANVETGISTQAVTDVRGVYLTSYLQPGTYRVTISAQGFAT